MAKKLKYIKIDEAPRDKMRRWLFCQELAKLLYWSDLSFEELLKIHENLKAEYKKLFSKRGLQTIQDE